MWQSVQNLTPGGFNNFDTFGEPFPQTVVNASLDDGDGQDFMILTTLQQLNASSSAPRMRVVFAMEEAGVGGIVYRLIPWVYSTGKLAISDVWRTEIYWMLQSLVGFP